MRPAGRDEFRSGARPTTSAGIVQLTVGLSPFDWLRALVQIERQTVSLSNGSSMGLSFLVNWEPADERQPYTNRLPRARRCKTSSCTAPAHAVESCSGRERALCAAVRRE